MMGSWGAPGGEGGGQQHGEIVCKGSRGAAEIYESIVDNIFISFRRILPRHCLNAIFSFLPVYIKDLSMRM